MSQLNDFGGYNLMIRYCLVLALFYLLTGNSAFSVEKKASAKAQISLEQYNVLLEIGDYLTKVGELEKSGVVYSILEIIKPDSPTNSITYYMQAIQLGKSGEFDQAIKAFNRAAKIDPTQADKYYQCLMILRTCKL